MLHGHHQSFKAKAKITATAHEMQDHETIMCDSNILKGLLQFFVLPSSANDLRNFISASDLHSWRREKAIRNGHTSAFFALLFVCLGELNYKKKAIFGENSSTVLLKYWNHTL